MGIEGDVESKAFEREINQVRKKKQNKTQTNSSN
jgi:hypothetical protein